MRAILYMGDNPNIWVFKDAVDGVFITPMNLEWVRANAVDERYRVLLLVRGKRVLYKVALNKEEAAKVSEAVRIELQNSGT